MSKIADRTGLKKFIGKKLQYEGTVERITDIKILLLEVSLLGKRKVLAEHLWLDLPDNVVFKEGDKISFTGVAGSYIDKFGIRKYNVVQVYKMDKYDLHKEDKIRENNRDSKYSRQRRHR